MSRQALQRAISPTDRWISVASLVVVLENVAALEEFGRGDQLAEILVGGGDRPPGAGGEDPGERPPDRRSPPPPAVPGR